MMKYIRKIYAGAFLTIVVSLTPQATPQDSGPNHIGHLSDSDVNTYFRPKADSPRPDPAGRVQWHGHPRGSSSMAQ